MLLILIVFLFFVLVHIWDLRYSSRNKICQWKTISVSYDISRKFTCQKYIRIINKLDIFYFLAFGSSLCAIRNEGLCTNDKDIDIIVPVPKNAHIFKCNDNYNISSTIYTNKSVLLSQRTVLCNHSRSYYSKTLFKYVLNKSKINNIRFIKTRFIEDLVMAFYISNNLYLDIYPTIANEWVYRDYNICRCKFCGVYTNCINDAVSTSKLLYGDDYLIPQKKKYILRTIRINI